MSRFSDQPFEILAVSVDDARTAVVRMVKASKIPGIQTWDQRGSDNPVAKRYNVYTLPAWFLIDANGIIRARNLFDDKLIPAINASLGRSRTMEARSQ